MVYTLIKSQNRFKHSFLSLKELDTKDYSRYKCINRLRVGDYMDHVKNAPDLLFRIDGCWFICLDNNLIKKNSCKVLSFGVATR